MGWRIGVELVTLVCITKQIEMLDSYFQKRLLNPGAVVLQCQSDIFTVMDQNFSNLLAVACYKIFYFRRKICDGILMYNLFQLIRTEISGIKVKLGSDWYRLL